MRKGSIDKNQTHHHSVFGALPNKSEGTNRNVCTYSTKGPWIHANTSIITLNPASTLGNLQDFIWSWNINPIPLKCYQSLNHPSIRFLWWPVHKWMQRVRLRYPKRKMWFIYSMEEQHVLNHWTKIRTNQGITNATIISRFLHNSPAYQNMTHIWNTKIEH